MNGLFEAADEVCRFLRGQGWEFCVIGGLAVQKWGEPRTTLDADLTLLADWGDEEQYVRVILEHFPSRIADAHAFARDRRVLLIQASNGKDVDIVLGALPFEVDMVRRAVPVEFAPGVLLPCCTAEDLFVMKAFAARPRDWADAESIAARQEFLDKDYIMVHLSELCALKEAPEIVDQAKRILLAIKDKNQ
jgi:hypothetical protein